MLYARCGCMRCVRCVQNSTRAHTNKDFLDVDGNRARCCLFELLKLPPLLRRSSCGDSDRDGAATFGWESFLRPEECAGDESRDPPAEAV